MSRLTPPRTLQITVLLFLGCFPLLAAPVGAGAELGKPQFHAIASGGLPTAFGSTEAAGNSTLDASLFPGTFGTSAFEVTAHVLYPLRAPFYFGGSVSYTGGLLHDYFLGTTTRYYWMLGFTGTLGVVTRPLPFFQAYAGGGIGMLSRHAENPVAATSGLSPVAVLEAGVDLLFLGYLAAGPRVELVVGPLFGAGGQTSSYGYINIGVGFGFSH